jgi:hypothetical protein
VTNSAPAWIVSSLRWLNPRRLRAQAIVLAICLWGVCAVDFSTPGIFDRAGNIKFQDFLPLYISAKLIAQHRAADLYNQEIETKEIGKIVGRPTAVRAPNLYGPQVGLLFVPLANLSFRAAAEVWTIFSLLLYLACVYGVWRRCPAVHSYAQLGILAAVAFPPVFHFLVRGQLSALPLACFTLAFLALSANQFLLAGAALGCLIAKPQFLVAIPLVLLLAGSWKILAGLLASAGTQLALTRAYFGTAVMNSYIDLFRHPASWINTAELSNAPIQMHSLRSFWTLLVPWPTPALALYVLSSLIAIALTVSIWKSAAPLALRFSALVLSAVLINPHLFIYDLLVLAPVLLLIINWTIENPQPASSPILKLLVYLTFVLPLIGPLSRWTHLQLSVLAFAALLWTLHNHRSTPNPVMLSEAGK